MSSRASPLRTLLTPKWAGLTLALIAAIAACVVLGRWQWQRTTDILAAERVAAAAPVDLALVSNVGEDLGAEAIGRPVTAAGAYRPDGQLRILHRFSDTGLPGEWVLTPLDLADGTTIGVLRGWIPGGAGVPTAAGGPVQVRGILHPSERFYPDANTESGTAVAISDAVMAKAWGPRARSGFIMLAEQSPDASPAGVAVVSPTVRTGDVAFPLQNFFYAFQWWIFAAFAIALYLRWLWLDVRGERSTVRAP